jgi:hypothetical protein
MFARRGMSDSKSSSVEFASASNSLNACKQLDGKQAHGQSTFLHFMLLPSTYLI